MEKPGMRQGLGAVKEKKGSQCDCRMISKAEGRVR